MGGQEISWAVRSCVSRVGLRRGLRVSLVVGLVLKVCSLRRLRLDGKCDSQAHSAKPWAIDVPLRIGKAEVKPGDILVADEGEMACCVIPRERLDDVLELLPVQKEADDGLLEDVQNGMDFNSALKRWPKHYSNH